MSKSKTIALFGGSFNPPHEGHFEMARRVARRKAIDEVWILPVYCHPFGKKMAPFSERLRLCQEMFRTLGSKVKVKDVEKKLGGMSWTVRLIRHLKEKYPGYRFSLILGSDAYDQRAEWKDFEEIQDLVKLIVFPRGPNSPIPDVSSTEIRSSAQMEFSKATEFIKVSDLQYEERQKGDNYLYLTSRPHPWRKQFFVKGRNMTVSSLVRHLQREKWSPETAAQEFSLPIEAVLEMLHYFHHHQKLIEMEELEEKRRLENLPR